MGLGNGTLMHGIAAYHQHNFNRYLFLFFILKKTIEFKINASNSVSQDFLLSVFKKSIYNLS